MMVRDTDPAHRSHVLLDTVEGDTLVFLETSEPAPCDENSLRITYDGTGMSPCLRLVTSDGEVELRGEGEITRVTEALKRGRRMAKAFGPRLSELDWRAQQGGL